jgi:hypothetical protein
VNCDDHGVSSYCAHDLVIGPCTSIEGVVISDVVMASSVFGVMVSFVAMVHIVRRLDCVWASAVTAAPIWSSASLAVLG